MTDTEHHRLNEIRARYMGYATSKSLDIATTGHTIEKWMDDVEFLLMRITELQTELWSYGLETD